MSESMGGKDDSAASVVIGMDPHKRTVTIEVMSASEQVVGHGRFTTDESGYAAMLDYASRWAQRMWAIEGCEGIGRHVARRLLPLHETVVDVPAKLSARMRVYATGQGRKTDDTDAYSVALAGVRMAGSLRPQEGSEQRARRAGQADRDRAARPARHRPLRRSAAIGRSR